MRSAHPTACYNVKPIRSNVGALSSVSFSFVRLEVWDETRDRKVRYIYNIVAGIRLAFREETVHFA